MNKAQVITAVEEVDENSKKLTVFLAGTIDNGNSFDWQQLAIEQLEKYNIRILNPRRKNWEPNASEDEVRKQVRWELDAITKSDVILMWIAENSKSPITLLELGLTIENKHVIVAADPSFYRRINLEETCAFHNIELLDNFGDLIEKTEEFIKDNIT